MSENEIPKAGLQYSDHFQTLTYINKLMSRQAINGRKFTKCKQTVNFNKMKNH